MSTEENYQEIYEAGYKAMMDHLKDGKPAYMAYLMGAEAKEKNPVVYTQGLCEAELDFNGG